MAPELEADELPPALAEHLFYVERGVQVTEARREP
jgi:hypothetical protein